MFFIVFLASFSTEMLFVCSKQVAMKISEGECDIVKLHRFLTMTMNFRLQANL